MIKLAIIGGRDFNDEQLFYDTLTKFQLKISTVVSGGAKGADMMGELWAISCGIPTEIYLPNWTLHGKAAGFIRNKLIIDASDAVIAFWDGESRGTKSSIDIAKKLNKPIMVVHYQGIKF